jgi:hypothetical protein
MSYLMEVIGMFKNKVGNDREERTLRMLRSDDAFQASPMSMGETHQENVRGDSQKTVRDAMLEAEYRKAKALCAFRNSVRFC